MTYVWLPELVQQSDGADWSTYEDILHNHFLTDFLSNPPTYKGQVVRLMRGPDVRGRKKAFWHIISHGSPIEELRQEKVKRCERIRWAREIIVQCGRNNPDVISWEEPHKGQMRALLTLSNFDHVVILGLGGGVTLISSYDVDRGHRRVKLQRQWKRATQQKD